MKTYESEIMFDKLNWVPENVTSARLMFVLAVSELWLKHKVTSQN